MNIRPAIIEAVAAWLANGYTGPVSIRSEVAGELLAPPYGVVRIGTAAPLAPGEPVWEVTVLIAVFHDYDFSTAADAEAQSGVLFAKMDEKDADGGDQYAAFVEFCEGRGLAVSMMQPVESNFSTTEDRWQNVLGVQMIACL